MVSAAPGIDDRLGNCYSLAATYMLDHERDHEKQDMILVHGSIEGFGYPRLGHAWVEYELVVRHPMQTQPLRLVVVHDAVLGNSMPRDYYHQWANAVEAASYSVEETREYLLRDDATWGPWHERPFGTEDCGHGRDTCDDPRCVKKLTLA